MSEGQMDMVTGEVAVIDETTGEVVQATGRVVGREGDMGLARYLASPETDEGETPQELAYKAIVEQILNSSTPDEVLTPIEAVNVRDELERPFELEGWEHRESEFEAGSPVYAILQVRMADTKERMVLVTGNQAVLAQLISLSTQQTAAEHKFHEWQAGGEKGKPPTPVFPLPAKVVEVGRPNRFGNMPLRLVAPAWAPKQRTRKA